MSRRYDYYRGPTSGASSYLRSHYGYSLGGEYGGYGRRSRRLRRSRRSYGRSNWYSFSNYDC